MNITFLIPLTEIDYPCCSVYSISPSRTWVLIIDSSDKDRKVASSGVPEAGIRLL